MLNNLLKYMVCIILSWRYSWVIYLRSAWRLEWDILLILKWVLELVEVDLDTLIAMEGNVTTGRKACYCLQKQTKVYRIEHWNTHIHMLAMLLYKGYYRWWGIYNLPSIDIQLDTPCTSYFKNYMSENLGFSSTHGYFFYEEKSVVWYNKRRFKRDRAFIILVTPL